MVTFTYLVLAASAVCALADPTTSPSSDDLPDFELGTHPVLEARQDYTQNYKTGGTVDFQPGGDGYSVTFSGASDFVIGKGWKKGTNRNITFTGSTTASSGTVLVSVYGWSRDPLIEYYIQEYSNGNGAAQGEQVGSFVSDGSTYDIWKHQQVDQPSIAGTTTFWQYISVRRDQRPSGGTVTVANHIAAWAQHGMSLGSTMDYQTLATEGWNKAGGNSEYKLSGSS